MLMTYLDGKYRVNAENDDARDMIKELAQCIKALAQDIIAVDEKNAHQISVAVTRYLLDACPAPIDGISKESD